MIICYNDFLRLLLAAPECESVDKYLAEVGGSVNADAVALLESIYRMAHDGISVKAISGACGISVRQIAIQYGLPQRTLEDWAAGRRNPPAWQLPLIAYAVLSDRTVQDG